jgi:hypothetical protein
VAVKHSTVTVGIAATDLISPVADASGNNYDLARRVTISNPGSVSVFIGGPGVTTTDFGYELKATSQVSFDLHQTDVLYGVVIGPGTQNVHLLHLAV